ncbi:MAG: winged helix-turn-helix domain-containing protein, partial [Clostridiales bacterium]|nr:winged helix-turn-helix domain-containing protein [Clostridiales bacterium]
QAALLNNNMTRLDNQLSVNNNNANDISAAVKSGNESAKQAGTHQYIADVDNQIVIPSDIQMKIETKSQGSTKLINDKADIFQAENLRIDFAARKVFKNNKLIELSYKEFELLKLLVKNTGIALSRNTLLEKVWGYDFFGETRTVDVHIYNLRQKIEDDYNHPVFIETIRSIGYRFNADVR